jgi:hypothetical protein
VSEVLPEQTGDDTDTGWGDDESEAAIAEREKERYLRERPPHHGD